MKKFGGFVSLVVLCSVISSSLGARPPVGHLLNLSSEEERAFILDQMSRVPEQEERLFLNAINGITLTDKLERQSAIKALAEMSKDKREAFVASINTLPLKISNSEHRILMINALARVDSAHRGSFAEKVSTIFPLFRGYDHIIDTLVTLDPEDVEKFADLAKEFKEYPVDRYTLALSKLAEVIETHTVETASAVTVAEKERIVNEIKQTAEDIKSLFNVFPDGKYDFLLFETQVEYQKIMIRLLTDNDPDFRSQFIKAFKKSEDRLQFTEDIYAMRPLISPEHLAEIFTMDPVKRTALAKAVEPLAKIMPRPESSRYLYFRAILPRLIKIDPTFWEGCVNAFKLIAETPRAKILLPILMRRKDFENWWNFSALLSVVNKNFQTQKVLDGITQVGCLEFGLIVQRINRAASEIDAEELYKILDTIEIIPKEDIKSWVTLVKPLIDVINLGSILEIFQDAETLEEKTQLTTTIHSLIPYLHNEENRADFNQILRSSSTLEACLSHLNRETLLVSFKKRIEEEESRTLRRLPVRGLECDDDVTVAIAGVNTLQQNGGVDPAAGVFPVSSRNDTSGNRLAAADAFVRGLVAEAEAKVEAGAPQREPRGLRRTPEPSEGKCSCCAIM